MDITTYAVPVIMAVCWCVGYIVKMWIKDVDNKFIPTICAVLGIVLNIWMNGSFSIDILLGGLASGLAATGVNELFSQLTKSSKETDGKQV